METIAIENFCKSHKISKHLQAGFVEHIGSRSLESHSEASLQAEYEKFCGVKLASFEKSTKGNSALLGNESDVVNKDLADVVSEDTEGFSSSRVYPQSSETSESQSSKSRKK